VKPDNEEMVKLGALETEVHMIKSSVNKLFEKFDDLVERMQPKQMGVPAIVGLLAAVLSIFALLFGSVIYITNSSNAPLYAQNAQIVATLQSMRGESQQNSSFIQLTNKEVSGLANKVVSNEETLRWLIFEENIPKQVSALTGEIETLKMQMDTVTSFAHNPHKGQ